jgi:hypothetical protein
MLKANPAVFVPESLFPSISVMNWSPRGTSAEAVIGDTRSNATDTMLNDLEIDMDYPILAKAPNRRHDDLARQMSPAGPGQSGSDTRQMPALQILRTVFTEQGAACRGLLLLHHSCRFMLRCAAGDIGLLRTIPMFHGADALLHPRRL